MREIKVRAWDNINKIMVYPRIIKESFSAISSGDLLNRYENIMQYTGLKDKNGTEIYEGDIIKDSEQIYIVRFGEIETVEIEFIGFYLEHIELIEFNGSFSSFDCTVIEVIGNIYQNPELIK